jgi:glycosyltransferase 2 family protein
MMGEERSDEGGVVNGGRRRGAVALPASIAARTGMERAWARIAPLVPVLRVLGFVAAVAIVVVMSVRAVRAVDFGALGLWPLAGATICAVVWWTLLARGWALLVSGTARRGDVGVWCRTQAIRYLPGGIWAPASRVTILPGTLWDKLATVGAENVIALCCAAAIGGAAFALGGRVDWLPLVIVIAAPVAAARLVQARSRVSPARTLLVTVNDAAGFVAYIAAAVLVQSAVSGRSEVLAVAGAAAVAWAAGLVVVVAPGGLGVREVVYVALLAGTVSNVDATAAAVTMRLVTVVAELAVLVALGRPADDGEGGPPRGAGSSPAL